MRQEWFGIHIPSHSHGLILIPVYEMSEFLTLFCLNSHSAIPIPSHSHMRKVS